VSDGQRDRAVQMVATAQEQNAKLVAGGHALNRAGAFMEPTVLSATPDMDIVREEVFGPVLSVMPFRNNAEAIEIANGTD